MANRKKRVDDQEKKVKKDQAQEEKDERRDHEEDQVIEAEEVLDEDEVFEAEAVEDEDDFEQSDGGGNSKDSDTVIQLQSQVLRLQADYQNYQKRVEREKESIVQYANENLVVKILDVIDNFDRALESEADQDSFYEGMVLIRKQLIKALESAGVREMESDGQEFDPNFHNAVLSEESDEVKSGHIIETLQKGYTLNDKVIRPAMVKVAK